MKSASRPLLAAMLSLALTGCYSAAFLSVNIPAKMMAGHQRIADISYGPKAHQMLDIYVPETSNGKRIFFIYGGGWTGGTKEDYYFVAERLTRAGYSVIIADYQKYPDAIFPSFVEDVALAAAWAHEHADSYVAAEHHFLIGHSAGAHSGGLLISDPGYLAAHGLDASIFKGFIGISGPYGFTPKAEKYQNVFGNLADYSVMQPLHHANGSEPPSLLLHGEQDNTVLPINTTRYAEAISKQGGKAQYRLYPELGHIDILADFTRSYPSSGQLMQDIERWIDNQVN